MSSLLRSVTRLFGRRTFSTLRFPTTGFEQIDNSKFVEEEIWEWYTPKEFYPVKIGEVFNSKYQVVGKLGYGAYGTTWLCRDLVETEYVTLKIGTVPRHSNFGELEALRHLKAISKRHPGALLVRQMLGEFEVNKNDTKLQCIVHGPMATTLHSFRNYFPSKSLPVNILKMTLVHVLHALDFLHSEAGMVHTDITESNIMLGMNPKTAHQDFEKFENQELNRPSPRKIDGERTIHTSRPLVPPIYPYGTPVLCDFGQARFGEYSYMVDIQPYAYRAPEVILDMAWNEKVDIWNVGVMIWDMFENGNLFQVEGGPENKNDNVYHLAHMVALLGDPPVDFLKRITTDRPWRWFDENGH